MGDISHTSAMWSRLNGVKTSPSLDRVIVVGVAVGIVVVIILAGTSIDIGSDIVLVCDAVVCTGTGERAVTRTGGSSHTRRPFV